MSSSRVALAPVRVLLVLAVIGIAASLSPASAAACPLCKDAKSDTDYAGGTASLPSGFYYSIVFMVCAPFAVIATLAARIVLARRRLARTGPAASDAAGAPEPSAGGLLPGGTGSPL